MQKYQILSAIGEGAYGIVLKCRDIENKSLVAVKKFKQSDDEEFTKKVTMREVKILKIAKHTNVVELKQAFRKKGIVYLVFEYVQNNLLQVLQKSRTGLKIPIIRKLMYQLLQGLQYLHTQNIIHRDIKPQNLLVSEHYELKICDFGFARQLKDKNEDLTDYVATRWYRPPQLLIGGEYGKEIDLWAVACIMCQLIDGNPLFPGQNELDQLFLIQKTCGVLPADLHERFLKNERFLGMKFPEIKVFDKLDKKYIGKICQKGLNLIKSLLRLNPKERLTARQALQHPFFDEQKSIIIENENIPKFERKQVFTSFTKRKRQSDISNNLLYQQSKYDKIYNRNKKAGKTINILKQAMKGDKQLNSKSVQKHHHKLVTSIQSRSLQKHQHKDIFISTQLKSLFIQNDQKTLVNTQEFKNKQYEALESKSQFPFLLYNQLTVIDQSSKKNQNSRQKSILSQRQNFTIKQVAKK